MPERWFTFSRLDTNYSIRNEMALHTEADHMSIWGFFDWGGALFLGLCGIRFATTFKAYDRVPWNAIWDMICVSAQGKHLSFLIGGLLGLTYVILDEFSSLLWPLTTPLFISGISGLALTRACLPPSILYLAVSQQKGQQLLSEVIEGARPFKVVHLIRSLDMGLPLSTRETLYAAEYRVRKNWQLAVRTIAGFVPLIVVDTRDPSDPITEELWHIFASGLQDKTFIIIDNDQSSAGMSDASLSLELARYTVSVSDFSRVFYGFGLSFIFTRSRSLTQYLENRIGKRSGGTKVSGLQQPNISGYDDTSRNIAGLSNESAIIRQRSASFFETRARQGRPIEAAVPSLFRALVKERSIPKIVGSDEKINLDPGDRRFNEAHSQQVVGMTLATAIAATLGVSGIVLPWDSDIDPSALRETLEGIQQSDPDPELRSEAAKYLNSIFASSMPDLLSAAASCDLKGALRAMEQGTDPNIREAIEGQTPLLLVIRNARNIVRTAHNGEHNSVRALQDLSCSTEMVQILINAGADVNARDNDGITALHWAAGYNLVEITRMLLKSGANVGASDGSGYTPLHNAASGPTTEIIQMLIEAGADVNAVSIHSERPLLLAEKSRAISSDGDSMEPVRSLLRRYGGVR